MSNEVTIPSDGPQTDDGFSGSSRSQRVGRGSYLKWNDKQGWIDRDGIAAPSPLLVVGVNEILRRWKENAAGGHRRQAFAGSRRVERRDSGQGMGGRCGRQTAATMGAHGDRVSRQPRHRRDLYLCGINHRRPYRLRRTKRSPLSPCGRFAAPNACRWSISESGQ